MNEENNIANTEIKFVNDYPTDQNSLKLYENFWVGTFPGYTNITGKIPLFSDSRISWLLNEIPLKNCKCLELGPLEGAHTYMLEKLGGAEVTAIESNVMFFLRCLITKNLYNLNAHFLLGDFHKFLKETDNYYDLISLCGVLYHSYDPVALIYNAAQHADSLFFWTHLFDSAWTMPGLLRNPEVVEFNGLKLNLYKNIYEEKTKIFLGGTQAYSLWLDKISLMELFEFLNMDVTILSENTHPNFPDICFLATKR